MNRSTFEPPRVASAVGPQAQVWSPAIDSRRPPSSSAISCWLRRLFSQGTENGRCPWDEGYSTFLCLSYCWMQYSTGSAVPVSCNVIEALEAGAPAGLEIWEVHPPSLIHCVEDVARAATSRTEHYATCPRTRIQ
jgi:hypothetical protein